MITPPDPEGFSKQGAQIVAQANALEVANDAAFTDGGAMLTGIKTIVKNVEAEFADPVKKAHEAHKSMVALRDKALAPFKAAETIIKQKLGTYQFEQQEKRRKEAERLEAEARAKAEAAKMKEAEKAMDNGDLEKCEKILETPVAPVPVEVTTPEAPKIAGVSFREDWDFVVEDVDAIPREYMIPDTQTIRAIVKRQGKACRIAGIRTFSKRVVAAGGRVA